MKSCIENQNLLLKAKLFFKAQNLFLKIIFLLQILWCKFLFKSKAFFLLTTNICCSFFMSEFCFDQQFFWGLGSEFLAKLFIVRIFLGQFSLWLKSKILRSIYVNFLSFYFFDVHRAIGCGQQSFTLVWRCHQLLSRVLARGHLPLVSPQSRLSANDKGDNEMSPGALYLTITYYTVSTQVTGESQGIFVILI